ncbi:hypothetical protein GCM10007916_27980 [Psychromonas marina]|uniref:Uncharacterized protein n=1 Tax=Psychromonas marina TaxID=88364 RepID=A0ABQ6E2U3_9GAMM|nr:hypothetical protein GCM10007916_27980 [Psychromonas marina]
MAKLSKPKTTVLTRYFLAASSISMGHLKLTLVEISTITAIFYQKSEVRFVQNIKLLLF